MLDASDEGVKGTKDLMKTFYFKNLADLFLLLVVFFSLVLRMDLET